MTVASEVTHAELIRYFQPVLSARKLKKRPVRIRLAGHNIVLFRDELGRPGALDDTCPHRRAPLSSGTVLRNGRLACGYHGWNFGRDGAGRSPSHPGLRRCATRAYQIIERFDYLWIAAPDVALETFAIQPGDTANFTFAGALTVQFDAPLDLVLDNISEDEHFPFVHSSFGWDRRNSSDVEMVTYKYDDRSEVRLMGRQRSSMIAPLGGVWGGDQFHNTWVTRFKPIHTRYTFWWEHPKSGKQRPVTTRAFVFPVAESAHITQVHMFIFISIKNSIQKLAGPLIAALARRIAHVELKRDARITHLLAEQPTTLAGMRLTNFDGALVHNRALLARYFGTGGRRVDALPPRVAADLRETQRHER